MIVGYIVLIDTVKETKMHDIYNEGKNGFVGLVTGLPEPVTNILYLLLILCAGYVLLKHGLPIIKSVTGGNNFSSFNRCYIIIPPIVCA